MRLFTIKVRVDLILNLLAYKLYIPMLLPRLRVRDRMVIKTLPSI